jgi:hypothetical protein
MVYELQVRIPKDLVLQIDGRKSGDAGVK